MKEPEEINEEKRLLTFLRKDIEKLPVLSKELEYTVAKKAQAGDPSARNTLIESNLRFVLKVGFRFRESGHSLMDLISEGFLGLIKAVKTFDPDRGCRFITYAERGITQRVMEAIERDNRSGATSIEEPLFRDGEETTIMDSIASDEKNCEELFFQDQIKNLLNNLDSREKKVIVLRFWGEKSLEEVGKEMGLRKERVRQIEARALRKMRWSVPSMEDWYNLDWREQILTA